MLTLSPLLKQHISESVARLNTSLDVDMTDEAASAVCALSDFVCDNLRAYPEWRQQLIAQAVSADEWKAYPEQLAACLESVEDEAALMKTLRLFRRHKLVRIAWGQTLQLCTTEQTLQQLSELAESLVVAAKTWLYRDCCHAWGTPCNQQGEAQPLLILGMGKLGGKELNFSSDIDLIFVYPENGQTQGGRRELENSQFFTRLGQRLIKVLDQQTVDGFVYRVDMRLRPFGDSGPLVLSFAALEDYYQEQGRDWERYAMVKARLLGSENAHHSQELQQLLRPFVFRRYIDFSVIQSLRNMKNMIAQEVRRRGLTENIKLGAGGIREIEFIAQVFQLIRGGREPRLQQKALLPTLDVIAEMALLEPSQCDTLKTSYLFLRRMENFLQAINDQQTQTLPSDELNRARLAWGMGFSKWGELLTVLQQQMVEVRAVFDALIGDDDASEQDESELIEFKGLWSDQFNQQNIATFFSDKSDKKEDKTHQICFRTLNDFRSDIAKRRIGQRGRDVLDQLMPYLLKELCELDDCDRVLPRLTHLLLSIVTRTTYLELLLENRTVLQHVIRLCAASPMVSHQLARHPLLLDELLGAQAFCRLTPLTAYRDELRQYLLRVPLEDEEQQLEALRQFKQAQQFRIAAADIAGVLPVMQVSDHLTYLAEAMIDAVVQRAWLDVTARFGLPAHLDGLQERGFAVLGYGKLGGWELGYSSDLDLVFLIDCPTESVTTGERSIDSRQFYLRLAQRIMHLFATRTSSGILYEVDARLRPSGSSGLLVSTIDAFETYQQNEAWTWEHQALVRSRMVYGDSCLQQRFEAIRQKVLCQVRDPQVLQTEVREMRQKMQQHLGNKDHQTFDIKADAGGITDIEFIAQYLVLRFSAQQPALTRWSDNVRLFELMTQHGMMEEEEAKKLTHAYVSMRDEIHRLALQEQGSHVNAECLRPQREQVNASWKKWLCND